MITVYCPFCNTLLKFRWESPYDHKKHYECRSHGSININIFPGEPCRIQLLDRDGKHHIIIKYNKHKMSLYDGCDKITDLPIDWNLIPENFKQKLKTYLTFQ